MSNENQTYSGYSTNYLPYVRDALKARARYITRMLFPSNGNFVTVTSESGDIPHATMALLNHYIRATKLRSLFPGLVIAGDIEGEYLLRVDWRERVRHQAKLMDIATKDEFDNDIPGTEQTQSVEDEVRDMRPEVYIVPAQDCLLLPATADFIEDCEIVCVKLHMTEDMIRACVADGLFDEDQAEKLISNMGAAKGGPGDADPQKRATQAAGVRKGNAVKEAVIYQAWQRLEVPIAGTRKYDKRRCVTHYWGNGSILSIMRNPFDCDRVPVIGLARDRVRGSIWGKPTLSAGVEQLQYAANDVINMGQDSAKYSLQPIIMTDPSEDPRLSSVVMSMLAIWEVNPNTTKILELPQLWKDAFAMAAAYRDQIFSSLGVTPAMIPHANAGKKPTQAQVAQDAQTAIENVQDEVDSLEGGVMADLLQWFFDLDAQYRNDDIVIESYGRMGVQAKMERIPPWQMAMGRYAFGWNGSEAFKSPQRMQMNTALMNVLRGIPPNQMGGLTVNLAPLVEKMTEEAWGPEVAPRVLIDPKTMYSIEPQMENEIMAANIPVSVAPTDDQGKHIPVHQQALQGANPAVQQIIKAHIGEHIAMARQQMAMQQQQQMGAPGMPGGQIQTPQPGVAGTPRQGAQPMASRGGQAPPGAVHQDQMQDPSRMPRPLR